jgi:tetrathionate reductase subunit B
MAKITRREFIKYSIAIATGLPPIYIITKNLPTGVRYGMLIDLSRCNGCGSCESACRQEFNSPPGIWRTWIKVVKIGDKKHFIPCMCNHCENAPCVKMCPVNASYKRKDGIVLIRYERCIGCRYCMLACPYNVRYVDPERHVIDKCNFCVHLVDRNLSPACVKACPSRAKISGNLNDRKSKIAVIIKTYADKIKTYKQWLKTESKVYYLGLPEE